MERLLAQIGLTYLSVLAVVFYLDEKQTAVLGLAFLCVAAVFLIVKKYRKKIYLPVMAFTAIIACMVNLCYTAFVYDKTVEKYSNTQATITAVLEEEPYKNYDKYYYQFKCTSVNKEKANFKFTSSHNDLLNIDVFDEIEVDAQFYATTLKNNISDGCYIVADFGFEYPQFEVTSPKIKPLYYYAVKLRQIIREFLKTNLSSDSYPLCSALFLGDKYALSNDVRTDFTHAGVSHIIVVSGMHFSIIFGLFLFLANKYYRYRKAILIPTIVLAIVYMALTGFTPSVFRSGVMTLFCVVGYVISREPYSPISLGVAGLAITAIKGPYIAGDVGLILSFTTTFSIIVLAPRLTEKFYKKIKIPRIKHKSENYVVKWLIRLINKLPIVVISMICVNISAYVVALPLSIIFFHSAPTLSIISGFVLYFPIEALMFLIFIMVVTSFLPFLTTVIAFLIDIFSDITFCIVELFANIPFSYIDVTYKFVCLWLLAYILLLFLLWSFSGEHKFSLFTILVTILFLTGYITATVFSSGICSLYVYDANDGVAVLYSSKEITTMLNIECTGYELNSVVTNIKRTAPKLDFAAGVNNSSDCSNSLKSLCEVFAIDTVLLYDTKRTVALPDSVKTVLELQDCQTVEFSDGSKAEYIMIDEKYAVYFTYCDKSLLIVPENTDVENLDEKYRKADTIILSDCPTNFDLLSCDTLVISTGGIESYNLMKVTHGISNRVLLTCEGDIKLVTEV